jgi:hypothetical protein
MTCKKATGVKTWPISKGWRRIGEMETLPIRPSAMLKASCSRNSYLPLLEVGAGLQPSLMVYATRRGGQSATLTRNHGLC